MPTRATPYDYVTTCSTDKRVSVLVAHCVTYFSVPHLISIISLGNNAKKVYFPYKTTLSKSGYFLSYEVHMQNAVLHVNEPTVLSE